MLLNAIVHKDYRNHTDIIIKIFDDRIMISNPGNLYGDLTMEDLQTDSYQPKHRNKLLAEAFYLMGEVEKYGTGLIRIRSELMHYPDLALTMDQQSGSIVVGLDKKTDKVGDKVGDKITGNQQAILKFMDSNPYISASELSVKIGISTRKIEANIKKMKDAGLVTRVGAAKGGYWNVI